MQNRSQSPPAHRSNTQIYTFIFNALDEVDGLVHNHPSGDPTPSTQDIKMTLEIIAVAKTLGLAVHDHIIVGRDGHASLRGMKLI